MRSTPTSIPNSQQCSAVLSASLTKSTKRREWQSGRGPQPPPPSHLLPSSSTTKPICRSPTTSAMNPRTNATTASPLLTYIGQVSAWDFPLSLPLFSPLHSSQGVAMSGEVVNASHVPGTLNSYERLFMAQRRPSALRPFNSLARTRDLLRSFSPPPFSVYPHCLPLQTTGSSSSLLSFLPKAPHLTPSSITPQVSPLPPVVSRMLHHLRQSTRHQACLSRRPLPTHLRGHTLR